MKIKTLVHTLEMKRQRWGDGMVRTEKRGERLMNKRET